MKKKATRAPTTARAISAQLNEALSLYQTGKHDEAEDLCQTILHQNPQHFDAIHLLSIINLTKKQYELALSYFDRALKIKPQNPEVQKNRSIAVKLHNKARIASGMALHQQRQFALAEPIYLSVLELDPLNFDATQLLGALAVQRKQYSVGIEYLERALAIKPDHAEAHNNRGFALGKLKRRDEALASYDKAIALKPDYADAYYNRGILLFDSYGDFQGAHKSHAKAVELKPNSVAILSSWLAAALPILYETTEEIILSRKNYTDRLQSLAALNALAPEMLLEDAPGVGDKPFFYLPYQALNDCSLQSTLGQVLCDLFGRLYPTECDDSGSERLCATGPLERKIHVGIVSHYFRNHSNWKIPIRGWVENIDRNRFFLTGYYTDSIEDGETSFAKQLFDRFVQETSIDGMCRVLRKDRPDVLIFPGVGMDKASLHLAALRFAPVQCVSWGHPVTTGMPTMDYFLSSDLMETAQADDHYSEKLVRLPNLSIHYTLPDVTSVDLNRTTLGLPEDGVLFLCPQSLQKYLPQHDALFVRIARQVPHARFLFLSHHKSERINEQLMVRLCRAFDTAGMSGKERVVFLPRLNAAQFRAMSRVADVCLDTPDWSGCNSSLELLAGGLPVVTLAGEFMRGRHTYAILKMMGIDMLIADSPQAYVDLAVRLAQDSDWRQVVRNKILQHYPLVCGDLAPVHALESFFVEALANAGIDLAPQPGTAS